MILYIVLLMGSSLLLSSMANEKKNRVMEILMLSITPRQMLTGKILGLGIAGLTQAVVWAGTGFLLLRIGGQTLNLPPGFELPTSILAWALVFFLLGYLVYASLMAGLGALAKDSKEASQKTILVIWPVIIPMFFMSVIIENPHGMLATVLSLVPLTAPITMMTRLAAGGVPLWQPLLAAGLLLVTAYVVIRAVSGIFRHLPRSNPALGAAFLGEEVRRSASGEGIVLPSPVLTEATIWFPPPCCLRGRVRVGASYHMRFLSPADWWDGSGRLPIVPGC